MKASFQLQRERANEVQLVPNKGGYLYILVFIQIVEFSYISEVNRMAGGSIWGCDVTKINKQGIKADCMDPFFM